MEEKELEKRKKQGFVPASTYKKVREEGLCLSTGLFAIDFATGDRDKEGIAGIRQRDIFEVLGPNNSLKTAILISMVATTLKRFGPGSVALLMTEAFSPDRFEQAGINLDDVLVYDLYDPETNGIKASMAGPALEAILEICQDPKIKFIGIDSVSTLVPENAFFDGKDMRDLDSSPVASLAKIFNNFIAKFKLINVAAVLLMISHYRESINTMNYSVISDDNTKLKTSGGRGKEFMGDVRLLCNSNADMMDNKHSVLDIKMAKGYHSRWTLFKNKYANTTNYRTVRGNLNFKTGLWNNEEFMIDVASFFTFRDKEDPNLVACKKINTLKKDKELVYSKINPVIYKSGSRTNIGEESFHGGAKAAEYLRANPELRDSLAKQLYPLHNEFFLDEKPTADSLLEN